MFHHFSGPTDPGYAKGSLSSEQFLSVLKGIDTDRLASPNVFRESYFDNQGDVCVTFDDNLKSQLSVAIPVLEKLGLKAFFFLYSGAFEDTLPLFELVRYFASSQFDSVERFNSAFINSAIKQSSDISYKELAGQVSEVDYLGEFSFYSQSDRIYRYLRDVILGQELFEARIVSFMKDYGFDQSFAPNILLDRDDIRYLVKSGHEIGFHSHSHPTSLGRLDIDSQRLEYSKSKKILEDIVNRPIWSCSYPNGSYDESSLALMGELDVDIAFRSSPLPSDLKSKPQYEIDRIDHVDMPIYSRSKI